jgi:surface antigen
MARGALTRTGHIAAALAVLAMAAPAQGQFGGLLRSRPAETTTTDGCSEGRSRSSGSRIAGGILGSIAGSAAGRAGGLLNYVPVAAFTDQITASIACKLDPEEQKQAAEATLEATRGDDSGEVEVGAMSAWASNTREDVSGTSTVLARNDMDDDGLQCIMVSDVIIVSGEETRADKRMCRRPPAARYAIAAA